MEDDRWEQNVEEDFWVKGHLSHRQKQDHVTDQWWENNRSSSERYKVSGHKLNTDKLNVRVKGKMLIEGGQHHFSE